MGLEKGLMKSVATLKLQYFGHVVRGSAGKLSLTIPEGAVNETRHQEYYVLDPQCAEMEWQDLWGIKSAGTRSKEMEEVVVGVLISHRTSIMKKAPKEEPRHHQSCVLVNECGTITMVAPWSIHGRLIVKTCYLNYGSTEVRLHYRAMVEPCSN